MIQPSQWGIAGGAVARNWTAVVAGPCGPSTAIPRDQVPCTGTSAAPWTPPGTDGSAETPSLIGVAGPSDRGDREGNGEPGPGRSGVQADPERIRAGDHVHHPGRLTAVCRGGDG